MDIKASDEKLNKQKLVHSSLLAGLNKEQLEAIRHKGGPFLIIAGAGTGKTTVITERIKHLIQKGLAKPSEILALTFTEKASVEMQERVDIAMPYGYTQMWISTFHSFCDRILRSQALHIGLNPNYKLNTEAESTQFVRKNLFKFDLNYFRPLGNPNKFIGGMLQHFSRLQDEDIVPNEYISWAKAQSSNVKTQNEDEKIEMAKWLELANAYKAYDELKTKEGAMDFGDLIIKTLQLFRQRQNVLREYQKQFSHVLVDEFQDTNVAQYELLKLLAPPKNNGNLTVVGDDSQSVYKFRGAAVSNILYFKKDYKKAKTIVLTKNYRSTQAILDSAYKLIRFNAPDTLEDKLGIDKNLLSIRNPKGGEPVKFIHIDRVENEAEEGAKEILRLISQDKYEYKDVAILVRANNHSEPFMRALSRHGVPYQFLGPGRLFKQPEIVDLISYLKVLYDFEDSVSMYRLLSLDYFAIPARDLIKITNYAKRKNISLFEASENIDDIYMSEETKEKIGKILKIVEKHQKLIKKETAGQLLYYLLEESGLIQKLLNPDTPDAEKKAKNISKFFDKLKTYEVEHEDAGVVAVVDWIDLASELGESPLAANEDWTDVNAVNILTIHSAKGLEFPIVFLVNLVSQRFPTIERHEQIPIPDELIKEVLPEGDFHTQEERRLFYVGMTRAKDRLYFTAADYYGEAKREKKLSPFVFEALGDEAIKSEASFAEASKAKQLSFLDYAAPEEEKQKTVVSSPLANLHIDYLSYSQIDTFRICPLHYKLSYIIRIPTLPSASLSFGSSIHATMKEFYEQVKLGAKASEKLIHDIFSKKWVNAGYLSKAHERKFFDKVKLYLFGFLKNEFDATVLPYMLEQRFTLPLPYEKGERPLKIGGVMDRVDALPDGMLHIVDYKTGATLPSQKEVDNNLQLTFYALAAASIKEEPFGKGANDVKLSLYFFDNQESISTKRTKKQLQAAVEEIYKIRSEIEKSDFKCSGSMLCENCEYKLFCRSDD